MPNIRRSTVLLATYTAIAFSRILSAASYGEIPYYLRQLEQTDVESKRMEYNKIIHEAVVFADLSDRKTVKKMEPIVEKIRGAISAGFDRPYLGDVTWLGSAVEYFEREKNRPVIDIPQSDWLPPQSDALDGTKISTFPDRIILYADGKSRTIAESANIHEAVISPDAKRAAFFRRTDDGSGAEIWIVDLKTLKRRKVAVIASCETILFAMNGKALYLQQKPASATQEAPVLRVSANGGKIKTIGTARTIETLVGKGRYKGNLIVFKATKHHLGTAQEDCAVAWSGSGREIGRLKNGPCR